MPEHPTAKSTSTPDLKTRVSNFMDRAEEILTHPLAGDAGKFKLHLTYKPSTGEIVGVDLDSNNIAKSDLIFLGTYMRPIIFTTTDDISLGVLIGRIEYEHPHFRGKFRPLRKEFAAWRRTLIIGAAEWADPTVPSGTTQATLMVGSASTFPDGVSVDDLVTDFYYADLYFNSQVWHSDVKKAAEYEAASPTMKKHIAKCAELRVLGAIPYIRALYDWVTEVRKLGLDI